TSAQQLEVVAHQPLVLLPLPDEAPTRGRRLEPPRRGEELLHRLRCGEMGGVEQVPPAIEDADIGTHRDPIEPALIPPGGERRREERLTLGGAEPSIQR